MRSFVAALSLALLVALVVPAVAGAWRVKDNAGTVSGTIVRGQNDWGARAGLIRTSGSTEVLANVMRLRQDDFDGWMLINGTSDEDWVGGILKKSSSRFTLGRVAGDHPRARAVKTADGSRWILSRRVDGVWHRIGSVRGDCHGAWAVGAARKLLWD